MRKFSTQLLVCIGVLFILVLCLIALFSPRPIVANPESAEIFWIQYNPNVGTPNSAPIDIDVENYPEQEILSYFSNCQERRTVTRLRGVALSKVALAFSIVTENGIKNIYLGDVNFSHSGNKMFVNEILDPQETLDELLILMNLTQKP